MTHAGDFSDEDGALLLECGFGGGRGSRSGAGSGGGHGVKDWWIGEDGCECKASGGMVTRSRAGPLFSDREGGEILFSLARQSRDWGWKTLAPWQAVLSSLRAANCPFSFEVRYHCVSCWTDGSISR